MKKTVTTIIFGLVAVLLIFCGAYAHKSYNEKYARTKATLIYEEKRTKMPSDFTYLYSANGKNYTVIKHGGVKISKRNISYNNAVPSDYFFGNFAPLTKFLFFVGSLSALLALYTFFGGILNLSFAEKIPPCIFIYYMAGIAFLTESGLATLSISVFTLFIIIICMTVKKSKEDYY